MLLPNPNHSRRLLIITFLSLMLCMSAFSATTFASAGDNNANLIVNVAWLDGDTIRIDVTDPQTEANSALAVPLRDYLNESDNSEFISIQAVDPSGKQSGAIEIKNPFYNPNYPQSSENAGAGETASDTEQADSTSVSAIDNPNTNAHLRPFTPDGTGTVIDNANDTDGKEFFTINSEDGNEFFLIIDRHRNTDNVYFLNTVTEEDLISLAQKNGKTTGSGSTGTSAIPTLPQPNASSDDEQPESPTPSPEPIEVKEPSALSKIGSNLLVMVGIMVIAGGLAYYIKVVRPKKSGYIDNYDDEADDMGYDDAMDDDIEDLDENSGGDDQ